MTRGAKILPEILRTPKIPKILRMTTAVAPAAATAEAAEMMVKVAVAEAHQTLIPPANVNGMWIVMMVPHA